MKKSLIFAGMLAIGFANAQEGNVGINTDQPKATLDIQPNATNLAGTTNEGILAPRLSKTRIANIEASKLTEGTLVYATDDTTSPISAYAGTDTKVAKITEKGYYFYNGTEWVKAGNDTTSQIWQKQTDKSILLVDSEIPHTVRYMPNGGYNSLIKNPTTRTNYYWDSESETVKSETVAENDYNDRGAFINNKVFGDQIPEQKYGGLYPTKFMSINSLNLDDKETSNINRFVANQNFIKIEGNSTKNYGTSYASTNYSQHFGSGKVAMMIGTVSGSQLFPNASATRMVGAYNEVLNRASTRVEVMEGAYNYLVAENKGFVQDAFASRNQIRIQKGSTGTINWLEGNRNLLTIQEGFTGKINNYTGTRIYTPEIPDNVTGTIENMYGVYVQDINKGTTRNFSIYTEAGKVRVGDLADSSATADRVVTVDANGVLKTGVANTGVKAGTTAETCSDANLGAIHFKEVEISGTSPVQKKGVFGFCTKQNDTAMWVYLSNGGNIMQGTGTFGQGL